MIFTVSLLAILVTACSKSPVIKPAPVPVPVINALSKVEYSGGDYDSLYYNSDLQVIKIVVHTNAVMPFDQVYTIEYDANKKVTRVVDNTGERYDYIYVNGVLGGVTHYIGNDKFDFKLYDYTNGKLTHVEEYYRPSFNTPGYEMTAEIDFEYFPDGNLKKQTMYGFTQQNRTKYKLFSTTYSDYDTKPNPTAFLDRFTYYAQLDIQKNNPGKMVGRDEMNGTDNNFEYAYTYNDFLNPLTRKTTASGGSVTTAKLYYY